MHLACHRLSHIRAKWLDPTNGVSNPFARSPTFICRTCADHVYLLPLINIVFRPLRLPTSSSFLCLRDDSQGALRFAPVCLSVCPSVRPSVRHTLWYRVCVINSSHSLKWIFLKPCISVVDILKMCMWVCGGATINFDRITAFRT